MVTADRWDSRTSPLRSPIRRGGEALTAADIYLATFMALFAPLSNDLCPIPDVFRAAFTATDDATRSALDPVLLAHRDEIYEKHLELPLTL
jgi:hypothetical protein